MNYWLSDSEWLKKLNYGIAAAVVVLGLFASYVTIQRNQTPVQQPIQSIVSDRPVKVHRPGEWIYACELSLDAMENCTARQTIVWPETENIALEVEFSSVKREEDVVPRLQLRAPLGSFLPAGFSLGLEGQEALIVPYQACAVEGCFVNLDLAPDVEAAVRKEGIMVVEYMTPEQKIATVKLPLKGINDVLARVGK